MNQNILGNIARTFGLQPQSREATLQAATAPGSYYEIFTHPPQQHVYHPDYRLKHTDSATQQLLQQYFSADALPAIATRQLPVYTESPVVAIRHIIDKAVERIFRNDPACAVNVAYTGTEMTCQSTNIALLDNRKKLAGMLQTLIEQAQGSGSIPTERDAALLAGYVVSTIGGFWQSYLLSGDKAAIRDMATLLADSVTGRA